LPSTGTHTLSLHDALPISLCSREAGTFLSVFSEAQFILKGGDLILQAAEHFPNCRFYFAGLDRPARLPPWPDNVFFLGKLEPEQDRKSTRLNSSHVKISYA